MIYSLAQRHAREAERLLHFLVEGLESRAAGLSGLEQRAPDDAMPLRALSEIEASMAALHSAMHDRAVFG